MASLGQLKSEAREITAKYAHKRSPEYLEDLDTLITTAHNAGLEAIIKPAKSCKECKKPIHIHPHDFYDNELDCNCTS